MNADATSPFAAALSLRGLTKKYGEKIAVDALDLDVRAGELYALLGPNGAGKTTTLRMVAGLVKPDAGSVSVFGIDAIADPRGAKQQIAWLPDEPMLYDKLTAWEFLEFVAGLWGVSAKDARQRAEHSQLQLLIQRVDPQAGEARHSSGPGHSDPVRGGAAPV